MNDLVLWASISSIVAAVFTVLQFFKEMINNVPIRLPIKSTTGSEHGEHGLR